MMPDHYATLGVDPTARPAEIRAAYLKLMREFHPDRNPSPEAGLRAQAAIAAFKVLGDFDLRNHYDWDRRREREAAAALTAKRPLDKRSGAVAAVAAGLLAVGAWAFLRPTPSPEPKRTIPPVAEARPRPAASIQPKSLPKRVAAAAPAPAAEKRVAIAKIVPLPPVRVAASERMRPKPAVVVPVAAIERVRPQPAVERTPVARPAPVTASRMVSPPPSRRLANAAPKPAQKGAGATTDLQSLDQFVMNFYGQSWRYGDAPKRKALVQSRNNFIARRGACPGEACKREAYLGLMREVSEIVESGHPKAR